MKIYAIRESWHYEVYDLVEFFLSRDDAEKRAAELTAKKFDVYDDYVVEEVEVK